MKIKEVFTVLAVICVTSGLLTLSSSLLAIAHQNRVIIKELKYANNDQCNVRPVEKKDE